MPPKLQNPILKITAGIVVLAAVMLSIGLVWQQVAIDDDVVMPTLIPTMQIADETATETAIEVIATDDINPVIDDSIGIEVAIVENDSSQIAESDDGADADEIIALPIEPEIADIEQPALIDVLEINLIQPELPQPERIVVQFSAQSSEAEREAYLAQINAEVTRTLPQLNSVVVMVPQTITTLPASTSVIASEPDYYARQFYDLNQPVTDTYYDLQWSLPAFDVPDLWAALPDNAPVYTVAVIDSGICTSHPDLAGKILPGYDYVDDDSNPDDEINGHGCGVAGVIAAGIDNGMGIAGVAPNAQIMPLRVLNNNGIGTHSDIASAIIYADR